MVEDLDKFHFIARYELEAVIGHGAFATVYAARVSLSPAASGSDECDLLLRLHLLETAQSH